MKKIRGEPPLSGKKAGINSENCKKYRQWNLHKLNPPINLSSYRCTKSVQFFLNGTWKIKKWPYTEPVPNYNMIFHIKFVWNKIMLLYKIIHCSTYWHIHRCPGLFQKTNIEHPTSNVEHRIMMSLRSAI